MALKRLNRFGVLWARLMGKRIILLIELFCCMMVILVVLFSIMIMTQPGLLLIICKKYKNFASISDLENKSIRILDLKICHSGELSARNTDTENYVAGSEDEESGYNIAIQFLYSVPSISIVRCWYGAYKFENNLLGHYERSFDSYGLVNEYCLAYTRSDYYDCFFVEPDYDIIKDGVYTNEFVLKII